MAAPSHKLPPKPPILCVAPQELATWRLPFEGMNPFQIITHVLGHVNAHPCGSGLPIPAPQDLPAGLLPSWQEYTDLMQACWRVMAEERPQFGEVVQRLRCALARGVCGGLRVECRQASGAGVGAGTRCKALVALGTRVLCSRVPCPLPSLHPIASASGRCLRRNSKPSSRCRAAALR